MPEVAFGLRSLKCVLLGAARCSWVPVAAQAELKPLVPTLRLKWMGVCRYPAILPRTVPSQKEGFALE